MADGRGVVTEVSITSNPNYLARLRRIIGCVADCAGMDSREIHDAKLVLTEACSNAIRHGSPHGDSDRVSILISSDPGTVVAEIIDRGDGFDPSETVDRATRKDGGLGIPLMRALADEVEFVRSGKGMTVRLTKRAKIPAKRHWVRISR